MFIFCKAEELWEKYKKVYSNDAASYQLTITDLLAFIENPELYPNCFFAYQTEGKETTFTYLYMEPYGLIVETIHEPMQLEKQIDECINALGDITLCRIQAPQSYAECFARKYTNRKLQLDLKTDTMMCDKVLPIDSAGTLRKATMDNYPEIVAMYHDFILEALHEEVPLQEIEKKIQETYANTNKDIWVYEVDGTIVSMAMKVRSVVNTACISAVYTKKEERSKGYCKQMMAQVTTHYLQSGYKQVSLYVDKTNPISNSAYLSVGYVYGVSRCSYE